jgi:O-antigen/teichoic acid export membrane protein
MLQSITIFSALIDISWLFAGLEQFNKIVIRNALVKIIGVVLIFSFVKTPDDLNLYIMINIGTQLIGQLVLWINISKLILKPTFSFELIKKHIKPMIKLFIPQIAIHVFVVLDKTMIGVLSNTSEVGLYDVSMKLIKMSLAVITSLGTVMLPRMSNAISNGETDKVNQYLSKSFRFQTLLAFPLMFGMLGIIENFVPWFFSPDFSGVIILISILSPIYITIAWSNVIGVQLMLPMKEDKKYTISVATGALINFTINLILIPRYGAIGAAIGTLISETAIFMIQFIMMKNFINLRDILEDLWKITISSILMYVIVKMIGILLSSSIITTIIQVLSGIFVYFASLHLIKLRLIIENHLYNELIKKIINFVRRTK